LIRFPVDHRATRSIRYHFGAGDAGVLFGTTIMIVGIDLDTANSPIGGVVR
jgi:hypothetical protein